jgi:hydroxyacylglutathione hydrolase
MSNWKTKNGFRVIRILSGRSNAYLMVYDNNVILVDTGKKAAFKTLSRNIESLKLSIIDISTLILTHTHFDHCQSAKKIKEISNCRIITSRIAEDFIKNGYTKLPDGTLPVTKLISRLGNFIGEKKFGYEPFHSDILVEDVYNLSISDSILKIIATPGHSPDSISIIVDNEIAIVGDAMFGVLKNSIFPPYSDDIEKMIESWGKLLSNECSVFLPGHGRAINRNLLEKEYSKYARK